MMSGLADKNAKTEGIGYAFSHQPVRGPSTGNECLKEIFQPLPGTYDEGMAIFNLFKSEKKFRAEYLHGSEASEETLKSRKEPPAILHLATHGYFCPQIGLSDNAEQNGNPLIYSGLVLAGSNRFITLPDDYNSQDLPSEDGILTALEVSGLNLGSTDLVVLSACQTGLGEVVSGEGVFGLRRAFQHAGSRSIIMSMWSIPDKQAQMLMRGFYSNWLSGGSKSGALRNASLELLSRRRAESGTAHPLFWGGFVLVGDPD
jgi:CHAT domain-containing protein